MCTFQNYPVHELSSFLFFIFPMGILVILYIRMGLRIRQTSEIQRNLPRSSVHGNNNNSSNAAPATVSSSSNSQQQQPQGVERGSFTGNDRNTTAAAGRRPILRMLGEKRSARLKQNYDILPPRAYTFFRRSGFCSVFMNSKVYLVRYPATNWTFTSFPPPAPDTMANNSSMFSSTRSLSALSFSDAFARVPLFSHSKTIWPRPVPLSRPFPMPPTTTKSWSSPSSSGRHPSGQQRQQQLHRRRRRRRL